MHIVLLSFIAAAKDCTGDTHRRTQSIKKYPALVELYINSIVIKGEVDFGLFAFL